MEGDSRQSEEPATPDLGDEVARYGPDIFALVFMLGIGFATLLGLPAIGLYLVNWRTEWGYFFAFLIPGILLGSVILPFGAAQFRRRCILHRRGLFYHTYWKVKSIEFVDIAAVELYMFRGAASIRLTIHDGSRIWLANLEKIDELARRIADAAHVQLWR